MDFPQFLVNYIQVPVIHIGFLIGTLLEVY